ncbi:M20 family metallo-hydrolase [Achromobacter aloeverae]|uniref:Zn-dependent hydrolase n=1 Tax=Achromobacter aloeverae TaxID=1750518 RepID=A0A4Q1HML2_9BURK|nr:M20 family metallo-hydrolase [Achromobacter aloeverae]RXN91035.1 Zn-dependent hydrolase [Achromobacter aloeverae]
MMQIDTERVLATLRRLARFGARGEGVCRPALSEDDMAARRWLADQMREAGLDARIDAVGNVYGRTPGARRALLVGSHSDSVPTGGWLDGALGVVFGIEAARVWRSQWPDAPIGIDVVSFSDEEGRYLSCLGSRAFCGELDAGQWDALAYEGRTLRQAAADAGLPSPQDLARLDPQRHLAYLEAHIEQGPRLDRAGLDIGVVTGIAGMHRYIATFSGRADHAGTTPMDMRHDAGMAAFEFAVECEARFRQVGAADSVWNFGAVAFKPGVANVVPKVAELTVELRDLSEDVMARMGAALAALAAERDGVRQVGVRLARQGALSPASMDARLCQALDQAAAARQGSRMAMPSGAIHDAMLLARHVPTGMMFVPSIDGRSHTPVENTADRHLALGAQVFFDGLREVARMFQATLPPGVAAT